MLNNAIAQARAKLTMFYEDSAKVYRVSDVDGVVDFALVHEGIACHLSLDSKPTIVQGNQVATAPSEFTLYCQPDTDIQEGDRLEVTHNGNTLEYDVGTVHVYALNRLCRCSKRGVL